MSKKRPLSVMPRQQGKSVAARMAREAWLNAGKTVLCADRNGTVTMRRRKHLTLMEFSPRPAGPDKAWHDEC